MTLARMQDVVAASHFFDDIEERDYGEGNVQLMRYGTCFANFAYGSHLIGDAYHFPNIQNFSVYSRKTNIKIKEVTVDFLYHWMTHFSYILDMDTLKERCSNLETAILPSTVVALNKYLAINETVNIRDIIARSPVRWTLTAQHEYVPKFYYKEKEGTTVLQFFNNLNYQSIPMFQAKKFLSLRPFDEWLEEYCYPGDQVSEDEDEEESIPTDGRLMEYNTRATNHFQFKSKPNEKKPLFLGVELELEDYSPTEMNTLSVLKKHAIFKRDGSLDVGVEICSAPATLSVHKEEFAPFFEKLSVPGSRLKARNTCGLHIHIDKRNMTALHIALLHQFVNNKNNSQKLEKLAGRAPNRYCNLFETTFGHFTGNQDRDKYRQVNLRPEHTVELRMFASTTKKEEFFTRLEFSHALWYYTKPGTMNLSVKDIVNWEHFAKFVQQNRKEYPYLSEGV